MVSSVTADLLIARAEETPEKLFAVFNTGERWTYQDTINRAWSVATGLADLGAGPGDPVLVWLPNGPESIACFLGVQAAGAVFAPLNLAYRGTLLQHAINLPEAKILIVHIDLLERLEGLTLPHLRTLVIVGGDGESGQNVHMLSWSDIERADPQTPGPERRRDSSDDMTYIYTSGTTGPSKAVRCSYRHHQAYADWFKMGDLGADDRTLVSLPMFHVAGTGWVYSMLAWGGSIAVIPRFSTAEYWPLVRELGATTTTIMAAMATFLAAQPARDDDANNSLRIALLVPHIPGAHEFGQRFGIDLWTGYAMSEVPGPLRTELQAQNLRTAGRATSAEWHVRLADSNGEDVIGEEIGELLVRHDLAGTVTDGYVNMPEATNDAWRDGWFHTGDLFRRDGSSECCRGSRRRHSCRRGRSGRDGLRGPGAR
jgi:crotonobetaine/carnitine-CoA ligase